MSRSVNMVILLGNLGQDAETKYTQSGVPCTKFSVATERQWKDGNGEWKKETDWHNVIVWRKEKLAEYLTRGTKVHVIGRLSHRKYEDRNGETKYFTEVVAEKITLCGGGKDNQRREQTEPTEHASRAEEQKWGGPANDDDVPF